MKMTQMGTDSKCVKNGLKWVRPQMGHESYIR